VEIKEEGKGGGRKVRKKGEESCAHMKFSMSISPFRPLIPNMRNEITDCSARNRTQRALMSVPLLIDPTRPAGIPVPVAYPYDYPTMKHDIL